jgi:hypothetical protein
MRACRGVAHRVVAIVIEHPVGIIRGGPVLEAFELGQVEVERAVAKRVGRSLLLGVPLPGRL